MSATYRDHVGYHDSQAQYGYGPVEPIPTYIPFHYHAELEEALNRPDTPEYTEESCSTENTVPLSATSSSDPQSKGIGEIIKEQYNKYKNDKWFWGTLILAGLVIVMALWLFFKEK